LLVLSAAVSALGSISITAGILARIVLSPAMLTASR